MPNSCQPLGLYPTRLLLSIGFSRQEYWSGLPFPSPGDLPNPGIKSTSPVLASVFFTTEPPGKPSPEERQCRIHLCEYPRTAPNKLVHEGFCLALYQECPGPIGRDASVPPQQGSPEGMWSHSPWASGEYSTEKTGCPWDHPVRKTSYTNCSI